MNKEFQKELLEEIIQDWTVIRLDEYLDHLKNRNIDLSDWIKTVQTIRRKKVKSHGLENGPRGGV